MMQLYRLVAVGIIYGMYLHYKNFKSTALDLADHYILLANHVMLLSVMIGGCIMQLFYQVGFGIQACLLLITLSFSKSHPDKYDLKYFLAAIGYMVLWALLRLWTANSWNYGAGTTIEGIPYYGVAQTLDCWNCSYREFILYPISWLAIHGLGIVEAKRIIQKDTSVDHSWKVSLINRKVTADVFSLVVQILFNVTAALYVDEVPECSLFWVGNTFPKKLFISLTKTVIFVVPALATYYFYHKVLPLYTMRLSEPARQPDTSPTTDLTERMM